MNLALRYGLFDRVNHVFGFGQADVVGLTIYFDGFDLVAALEEFAHLGVDCLRRVSFHVLDVQPAVEELYLIFQFGHAGFEGVEIVLVRGRSFGLFTTEFGKRFLQ